MPRKDGTGPDGRGPKQNNQGTPSRDGRGGGRRGKGQGLGRGGGKRGGKK